MKGCNVAHLLMKLNGEFFAKPRGPVSFCLAHKVWWNRPQKGENIQPSMVLTPFISSRYVGREFQIHDLLSVNLVRYRYNSFWIVSVILQFLRLGLVLLRQEKLKPEIFLPENPIAMLVVNAKSIRDAIFETIPMPQTFHRPFLQRQYQKATPF